MQHTMEVANTMTKRSTHITELATAGYELAEDHLALVAGGLPSLPRPKTIEQYITAGSSRLFDERYDW
jgi:hypothetical protein